MTTEIRHAIGGKLLRLGRTPHLPPPPPPAALRVANLGARITPGSAPPVGGWAYKGDAAYPALPNLPTVNYTDLYQSGDTVGAAISRLASAAVVVLPAGFDADAIDFAAANTFGVYSNYLLGFMGQGPDQARLRMGPGSSTKAASVPTASGSTNPFYIARIGMSPSFGTSHQTLLYGLTIEGTDQPLNSAGRPHNYGGLMNYQTSGSVWQNLRLICPAYGDNNSPPGETFAVNDYKGTNNIYRGIEVTGLNRAGARYGGSPFGGNASTGTVLEDVYVHDSLVSSMTFSFSGSVTDPSTAYGSVTTRNTIVANDANWSARSGYTMTGINHENVQGTVRHYNPDITKVNMTAWNASHVAVNSALADNADIQIIEPVWHASNPLLAGCFTVQIRDTYAGGTQKQTTPPTVIKNGVTLSPVHVYSAPSSSLALDPTTQYVVVHGPAL